MQQLVVDKDGSWFLNKGSFPFTDPTTGVQYAPRLAVKAKETDWLKSQPVIEKLADDAAEVAPEAAPETAPEQPAEPVKAPKAK